MNLETKIFKTKSRATKESSHYKTLQEHRYARDESAFKLIQSSPVVFGVLQDLVHDDIALHARTHEVRILIGQYKNEQDLSLRQKKAMRLKYGRCVISKMDLNQRLGAF